MGQCLGAVHTKHVLPRPKLECNAYVNSELIYLSYALGDSFLRGSFAKFVD
jgi:hypothetical protein